MHYKVYFDTYHLLITNEPEDLKGNAYSLVISDEEAVFAFRMEPSKIFNGFAGNIAVITPFAEETLESIFDYADGIVAAGGLIFNADNEILCIHRRGFWDLPKGKVDKGEKIAAAALREVEEETAVKATITDETPLKTYHCYVMKGINCIKETYWYKMKCKSIQELKPQTEEDITEVKWMNRKQFDAAKKEFYPLIAELVDSVLK